MKVILSMMMIFLGAKTCCFAVPEIVQIVLAEKWFKTVDKYHEKDKQEFVLGSLMNNINFFLGMPAVPPSQEKYSLNEIYASEPFEAGRKFFYYVHQKKMQIRDRWEIGRILTGIEPEYYYFFLRLLEDDLLYDPKVCGQVSNYLSAITTGEIMSGFRIERLAIWHGLLYKYFSMRPSISLMNFKADHNLHMAIPDEKIEFFRAALMFFSSNERIKAYIVDMVEEFDRAFEIFKLKHLVSDDR